MTEPDNPEFPETVTESIETVKVTESLQSQTCSYPMYTWDYGR